MDIARILHDLTVSERLPIDALRAADRDRLVILPALLAEIERYLAGSPHDRAKPNPLFFIFHLLGAWREKSAYKLLVKLLRSPPHEMERLLGDGITTTSHRVIAAVFDGDPQPLYDAVLDRDAEEYIRSRMCETLAVVSLRDELARDEAARFLRACWDDLEPQHNCFVWNGWQSAIAMLGLTDLKPLVAQAFQRGSIDSIWLGFEHFEQDLAHAVEHGSTLSYMENREYALFGDTVEELSSWYGFSDQYWRDRERRSLEERLRLSSKPALRVFPKIGRNDPCPCGSGKKFKKCCLNAAEDRMIAGVEGIERQGVFAR